MKRIFSILFVLVLLIGLVLATAAPVLVGGDTINIINVPADYSTIQEAIDAASDGDTIVVGAGLYPENVVIDKSLTLKGAQGGVDARARSGDETIIEADEEEIGISIITAAGRVVVIDGLTVQNALHAISTPEPVMAADITVKNVRVLNTGDFGISLTFTESATVEYCYVEDARIGINAGALVPFPSTVATFRNNEVINVKNSITGYLQNSLIEGNLVWCQVKDKQVTEGTGISGQFLDTEIKNNTVKGYVDGAGMSFAWHYGRPLSENVAVECNTFTGNSLGIYVFDTQTELTGITVNFNNIAGNSWYGVRNDGEATLDATYNWWGANDGPRRAGPGSGDAVSANVDFEPWLGAALVTVKTETVTDGGTVDATEEADTEVDVTGTATVIVTKYDGNPGGSPPIDFVALGKYVDVYVPDTGDVTEIEIRLYYTDAEVAAAGISEEESLQLYWWNGTEWVECSDSGVNTAGTNGYSGYMWAKIRETGTIPSLADLQGTPFGGYGSPPPAPQPFCFIATAAYGTDTAREIDILRDFRDTVLLSNSLGAQFVSIYYKTSPPIANFISQHEVLRTVVRLTFVDPIVAVLHVGHDFWSAGGW